MRKKRGSILIYVMTLFAVLMIMGATLSTLTLQSMKNRKYYANSRVNLYFSESGIDEAYGVATEYVKLGSNYALNETNIKIEEIAKEDKNSLEQIFNLRQAPNYDEAVESAIDNDIKVGNIKLTLFDKFGELNEEVLEKKQDELFKEYYIKFFTLDKEKNTIKLKYDLEHYSYSAGNSGNIEVEAKVNNENVTAKEEFSINIISKFKDKEIERVISTDFKFTVPDYGSKMSFPTQYKVFPESPVWNKGIVVNKALSIGSSKLEVNGDVYVKGEDKGAILMNSQNSKFSVNNGKLIGCEGVKFDYNYDSTKTSDAKIALGGSLYTKGILFNKEDSLEGAQGARLHVGGSIYVLDDCEINAKNSTLHVDGSYYGVSNGDASKGNRVDNSSSIIINSEDLGEGGSTVNIGDKVYLAGTAYIKGLNDPIAKGSYDYQTGESISIKGNYKAYSGGLKNSYKIEGKDLKYELEKTMLSPLVLATHYNKYSKWFTIYAEGADNKIYLGMDSQLKEKYQAQGWIDSYIIEGIRDKKFKIDKKEFLTQTQVNLIKNSDELIIKLVKMSGEVIEEEIKVSKLEKNIEAFLYVDDLKKKNIYVTITPKGKMDSSLNGARDVVVKGKSGFLNEFIEVSEATEGEKVSLVVHCAGNYSFNTEINLLSYSTYFQSFNVFDKSKYFKQFYDDYNKDDIINKGKGITIGNDT